MQERTLGMGSTVQFLSANVIYIVQLLKVYIFFQQSTFSHNTRIQFFNLLSQSKFVFNLFNTAYL